MAVKNIERTTTVNDYKAMAEKLGMTYYTAVCECAKHKNSAWVRVSVENWAKVSFLLQANTATEAGAKAVSHDILNRVA